MVSAGRVLIIPRGAWSNLETYEMLDIVSLDGVSYIGRKQSVGVNPSTDTQMQYWQPFGTAAEIATTEKAGLVMPDGTTITIDEDGLIKATLEITGLDDVNITSIANGQILVYNSTTHKWENKNFSAGNISYDNRTSGLDSNKVQGAIDEVVEKNKTLTPTILTQTLTAGSTSLTFTNAAIKNNSRISFQSDPFTKGLIDNAVQSGTTVTLTCKAQLSNVSVKLIIYND